MTIAPAEPHTDAVEALLAGAGVAVGRGQKPAAGGWQGEAGRSTFVPYAVLYPSTGVGAATALCDPNRSMDWMVQVTVVGATSPQAGRTADLVKATLTGTRLSVPGRSVHGLRCELDRPITRDDQMSPVEHYAVLQFETRSDPA